MESRVFKNILGFRIPNGSWVGFHAHNLTLAELSQDPATMTAELNEWSDEIDPSTRDAKTPLFINSLSVNVSQVCNLACTYCAAGGDGTYGSPIKRLNVEKFRPMLNRVLDQLPEGETLSLHLLGGEPLLYPGVIREIAQEVAGRPVKFSITTNGTLINAKNARLLADLNMGVTISLDGDREINDLVRPNKGKESSTELTLKGLEQLRMVRSELDYVSVNCVFGKHNLKISQAYQFLRSLNMNWDSYNFNFSNEDKSPDVNDAYIANMHEVAQLAYSVGGLSELAKIVQFRGPMSRLEAQTRLNSYCGAGKSLIQVDTSQDVYPCNWFMGDPSEKLGHTGDGIDEQKRAQFLDHLNVLNDCGTCWARHLCAGGCMAVHKAANQDRHSKDPQFCKRSRSLAATAIAYYYQSLTNEGGLNESH